MQHLTKDAFRVLLLPGLYDRGLGDAPDADIASMVDDAFQAYVATDSFEEAHANFKRRCSDYELVRATYAKE